MLCLLLGCGVVVYFGAILGSVWALCVVLSFVLVTVTTLNLSDAKTETKRPYPPK